MKRFFLLNLILILCSSILTAQDEARLLRFPAIHGDQIVFSYSGDLYSVERSGGIARKLTSDIGYEMFARFSPDGKRIAFTAQYDGNTEVFIIPAKGGVPERQTFSATLSRDDISDRMGPNNIVIGWKDNDNIIYRTRAISFNSFKGNLFLVSVKGGLPEMLPLPCGGFCSYSPDHTKLAYNQVFREFRTWKYYRGGMADDIWIYDFNTKKTINITNNPAQDIIPMWKDNLIYFLSDRDWTMNLFVYNTESKVTRKLTNYTDFDIKFPSIGNDAIIYEKGGFLYIFDLKSETTSKVSIQIADDLINARNEIKDASNSIRSYSASPGGERLVFGARGDVFSVPSKSGITRNLTNTSGIHERDVEWSPDGKNIAFISDKTGENEIYIIAQEGNSEPIQITSKGDTYKYSFKWSPDSKKILWSDKKLRLQYVDIETKKVTLVSQSKEGEYRSFNWSPDSRWITYTEPIQIIANQIYIYNLESGKKKAVTDTWYDSGSPVFSSDGKYLFFVSARDFNPIYSWIEWNHAYRDMQKVYLITLTKNTPSPFEPENDVVITSIEKKEEAPEKDKDKKDKNEEEESVKVEIDLDGITNRIAAIPGSAGRYWNINHVGNVVYYCTRNSSEKSSNLMMYDLEKKKSTSLGNYSNYFITADNKKMIIAENSNYSVIDLPKSSIKLEEYVSLENMKVYIDLKSEWQQIFDEAWRQMRDFFYDPDMHGADWNAIHNKYNQLVPYANNRNDLNYILGEMIGELNCGHAYINGGDKPKPKRVQVGLLGAQLSRDKSNGYYRIDHILKGENWTNSTRSPLTEIGVNVKAGDYILAVNGKPTNLMNNIFESLINTAGKQVELTVNSSPSTDGSRKVIVIPIDDESKLYYYSWVHENIRKVDELTNGQVGYIHIPDMSAPGLNEFVKYFYPQLRKKALIIDDRGNGGGNVSPMIIERLMREIAVMGMARNTSAYPSPREVMPGPKVCLIDQYSASDGDLFPYRFKTMKLGKLIGVRTWGGVVGIRGSLPFIDGASLHKPEFAHFSADGSEFIIEGYGVDPDIEVRNDPAKEFAGEDEQLLKAIEIILEELKTNPGELPDIPPFPKKTKPQD
ncbi:PDZ domain-containing protein [candidate division KSB1 bacterium]